jgi:hypothetical protein
MFGKKNVLDETLPEDRVHLKPLLGIRPGVYLTFLYGAVLGIIFFFILLYPGLANPGTLLAVTSEPFGAAVRVDGVYRGTSPCDVFLPKGTHQLELILPGFTPRQKELNVQGRLFGSVLFPLKKSFHETLAETSAGSAFLWAASDYGMWSFTGEPAATYQIPQSLSEGAYRSGPAGADPRGYRSLERVIQGAARFASTKAGLRDILRAKHLIDNAGCSVSPVSLLRSIEDILSFLSETPGTAEWLAGILPSEIGSRIAHSDWYAKEKAAAESLGNRPYSLPDFGPRLTIGAMTFREITGGTFVPGGGFSQEAAVHSFWAAETEASVQSWEAFLEARPEWRPDRIELLRAQGLVTEDYLKNGEDRDSSAVAGVSWYAAQAYCEWLTGLLPPEFQNYEVRLPTETEWEYAGKAAEIAGPETSGFRDFLGGFWEWCADPYAPNPFIPADPEIIRAIGAPERSIRGNSWNTPLPVQNETAKWAALEARGSLFPASCSPFGSFRPVIASKEFFHE